MTKKQHRRRYALHQKVKNKCILDASKRTILVPFGYEINDRNIKELVERFHYNIQQELINSEPIEVVEFEIL